MKCNRGAGAQTAAANSVRGVRRGGGEVEQLVLNTSASSHAVLTPDEKALGVALVDIGAEQRVIEQLMGHSSRSMTARYSRGGIPLQQLAAAMEARDWGWVPG